MTPEELYEKAKAEHPLPLGGNPLCKCGVVLREASEVQDRRVLAKFDTDIRAAMSYMHNLVLLGELD